MTNKRNFFTAFLKNDFNLETFNLYVILTIDWISYTNFSKCVTSSPNLLIELSRGRLGDRYHGTAMTWFPIFASVVQETWLSAVFHLSLKSVGRILISAFNNFRLMSTNLDKATTFSRCSSIIIIAFVSISLIYTEKSDSFNKFIETLDFHVELCKLAWGENSSKIDLIEEIK